MTDAEENIKLKEQVKALEDKVQELIDKIREIMSDKK